MEQRSNANLDEALQLKEFSAEFDRLPFSEWVDPDCDSFESLHTEPEKTADPSLSNISPVDGPVELSPGLHRQYSELFGDEFSIMDFDADVKFEFELWNDILSDDNLAQSCAEVRFEPFAGIRGLMFVKEQPKAEQRTRYVSDGCRFLPDSRKHPMAITLPDLSAVSVVPGEQFGIIITMVTSMDNPQQRVFVHVNGIKCCTIDAIDLSNGSIFLPLIPSDIAQCEKKFPRLSISCKKFDEYTFDLVPFNAPVEESTVEKYTVCNEDLISKVAKGKLFASEYNLLTYKFVFQLALKKGDQYFVDNIQCETDLITDQKKVKNVIGKKPVASKVASKTPGAKSRRRARKPASPVKTLKRLKVTRSCHV